MSKTLLEKASIFALKKHSNQKDSTGKSYYISHILQVVSILKEVTNDDKILSAAFLHDTLEDTNTTLRELKQEFGDEIASLVYEVTHEGDKSDGGYYFPRLKSRDAILIKFADRLSNLSRMENWPESRQNSYIKKSKFWDSNGHDK